MRRVSWHDRLHGLRRLLLALGVLHAAVAGAGTIDVPQGIRTHDDGRQPVEALYAAFLSLQARGWTAEVVVESRPEGTATALPVIALLSPKRGPATWILAGIHGEEPAGPNALAAAIDDVAALGAEHPVVLLPLLNPHGYARNWRYLNVAVYSQDVDGHSVGDSSHLLPAADPARPRADAPSSPEAAAITAWILRRAADYPPHVSLDLHEDNLIHEGYVYSQGALGTDDPLAAAAVAVLAEHGVPIKQDGATRFGEAVSRGLVGPVEDSSIDELMSAGRVVAGGCPAPGPGARTVLVFETPAAALDLPRRVAAHAALIRRLAARLGAPDAPR